MHYAILCYNEEDVVWSMRSMIDGTLITAKGGSFAAVDSIEVRVDHARACRRVLAICGARSGLSICISRNELTSSVLVEETKVERRDRDVGLRLAQEMCCQVCR